MGCKNLGVLVDTSVFIGWFNYRQPYNRLSEPIENEPFYLVVCNPLYIEYLRRLRREYSGANEMFLELQLKKLASEICHCEPVKESLLLMNHKDQKHLDCAHNRTSPAHLLISDDAHFKKLRDICPLPIILTIDEFLDSNTRSRACGDAVMQSKRIKQVGWKKAFQTDKKPNH